MSELSEKFRSVTEHGDSFTPPASEHLENGPPSLRTARLDCLLRRCDRPATQSIGNWPERQYGGGPVETASADVYNTGPDDDAGFHGERKRNLVAEAKPLTPHRLADLMRFQGSSHPPPFLNRKDQYRLLGLVGLLTLILIAVRVAARPETWKWMFPAEQTTQSAPQNRGDKNRQVDHRVQLDEEPNLKPGEFLSRRVAAPPQVSQAPPADPSANRSTKASAGSDDFRFDPRLFENVRDNTLGIRHEEAHAYRTILERVRSIQLKTLDRVGKRVSYTMLMLDSERFRGRPITLEGRLHRLLPLPARRDPSRDSASSHPLYEAWLFTDDSGNDPYRIVCTEIADGLPVGKEIRSRPRVRVTGYFFKRQGYASQGGLHVAPLLLARGLRRMPPAAVSPPPISLTPWIVGLVLLIGGTLAIAQWRFTRSDRAFSEGCLKQITAASPEAIESLEDVETIDPTEIFRQLAREDAETRDDETT